jgi:hypothetical protein
MKLDKTEAILKVVGQTAVELVQANIIARDKVATRNLFNSVNYKIERNNFSLDVNIYAAPYFNNIVAGWRKGTLSGDGSFLINLIRWVKIKSIATSPIEAQRAAWKIREHIFEKGIPPVDLLQFVREQLANDIDNEVRKAIREDMNASFTQILTKYRE